jgi:hypothetical protein
LIDFFFIHYLKAYIESDIEEFCYDCYISRTMGYTVYVVSYFFLFNIVIILVFCLFVCFHFFSARMTQMMIRYQKKTIPLFEQLICLLVSNSIIFVFVFSRLPSSWRGHINKPANPPWHSRSKVVQDRTPGNLKNACAVVSCLLYFLQLKLSYLVRF